MRRTDPNRQLGDAADLLYMLELLTTGLATSSKGDIPWPGVRLTLRQAREAVLAAKETLALEALETQSNRERLLPRRNTSVNLAERILQVPATEGRVRELSDRGDQRGFGSRMEANTLGPKDKLANAT